MSGIPAGDRIKVEAMKLDGEKMPKLPVAKNDIEIFLTTVIGGGFLSYYGKSTDIKSIGYLLASIGSLGTIIEFVKLANPYRKIFENLNLVMGDNVPKYLKKRKTDYGYSVTLSLPPGMSTKDFEKEKLGLSQYLNKDLQIDYNNHKAYFKIYKNKLCATQEFRIVETKGITEFPVGVTYGDKIITVDMEKMVHLLIAGQTGSGKSTLIRGIVTNLIVSKTSLKKDRLYLHLIDLKNGAEFNVFRKCKIVKSFSRTIDEAEIVLMKLTNEVERRYDLFYENNVVDIKEYNRIKGKRKLSYEICIIDEFADLQDEKGSIEVVEHLARKARAAGIHLILATQRPSADIINGNIKANVPCIIGLKTLNSLNSRIIIDQDGLESLRGKGHGYLQYSDLTEFQSMFLDVDQARKLIEHTYEEKKLIKKVEQKKEIRDFGFLEVIK